MPEVIAYTTEEAWLAARAKDLTSTESAALFGMSPYMTRFELWHRKKSGVTPEFTRNERMSWGNHLEAAIANGIAEERGWDIRPLKEYMRVPGERMGSSFDFVILNHPDGPAHLEIKNVDYLAYRDGWLEHDDGTLEAPAHIEMQIQHQLGVSGFAKSYIGALVGGNRGVVIERDRDEQVIAAIRAKVAEFWHDVDAGIEPPAVFPKDAEAMIAMYGYAEPGKVLDASSNADIAVLCAEYHDASRREKVAGEDRKVALAKLLAHIGDAERVLTSGFKISAPMLAEVPPTQITQEMVGSSYGGRKGYRRVTVTETKDQQ